MTQGTTVEKQPIKTQTDLILENYPGNKVRQKAIGVDLSDFEQLKVELEPDYDKTVTPAPKPRHFAGKNKQKLWSTTLLNRNQVARVACKPLLQEQIVRAHDRKGQTDERNETEREYSRNSEEKNRERKNFVLQIFKGRPCVFKK